MIKDRISYKDLYELIDRHINVVNENIKETNNNIKSTNSKLDRLTEKLEDVRVQTTKTNGRVSTLEQWECDVDKIIHELQIHNKDQDNKINISNKEIAMISVKVAGILTVIGFLVYMITGYVI